MSGEPRSARQSLRMLVGEAGAYYQANLWQKLAESEEDLLEHRTDGSDAFDTLYIGCEKFPHHDYITVSTSGVL